MRTHLVIVLLCAFGAFSAHISPKRFLHRPRLAGKNRNPKIIGGQEATPHSIPYQVGLDFDGTFCGGTLITPRHVLTAAACAELSLHPNVILGAHRIEDNEPTQVILIGRKVIIHEEFNPYAFKNDIAIVELPQEVTLNENIDTIPLVQSNAGDLRGITATASGWGLTFDGATSNSPVLRVVSNTILSNSECKSRIIWSGTVPIPDTVICMEVIGPKNICTGDTGGPLTAIINDRKVLIGILLYASEGCELEVEPSFNTRLTDYIDWIQEKIPNAL